jgi:hypothetical protein
VTLLDALRIRNVPYRSILRGAQIHKVPEAVLARVAVLLVGQAAARSYHALPTKRDALCYLCAVVNQESRFDPQAFNRNLTPLEAVFGSTDDLGKGDWGIGMFKLKYVRSDPAAKGMTDQQIIDTLLFDPVWSLDRVGKRYAMLLAVAAKKYLAEDPRWIATGIYNRGDTGFAQAYTDRTSAAWASAQRHMNRVKEHFDWFQQNLTREA